MAVKRPGNYTVPPAWAKTLVRWRSEFGSELRRRFRSRINNSYDAEDLESIAVLSMLLRLTPEQIGNLNGYIYTVARNALTQEFTKRDLERKALETIFREYPQLLMGSEPPPSDEIILFQQRLTVVNESLDLLTDKEKLVFEQRRAGQTLAQIAEMTGMALSTVSTHLQRALTKIRDNSPPDTQE